MPVARVIRYVWAAPASALGLLAGVIGGWRARWAVVDGVVEVEGPVIAWGLRYLMLLPGGASALTLGHVVLGRDAHTLCESRDHEHVHVRQYEVWGPFFLPAYAVASAWAALRGRHYYFGNAFEQEAYASDATRLSDDRRAGVRPSHFTPEPARLKSAPARPRSQQAGDGLQLDGAFGGEPGA